MKHNFTILCLIIFISGFVFCSCNNGKRLQSEMENLIGQKIEMSRNIVPDSIDVFSAQNKLIIWFDSTECGSCRMSRLHEWNNDPVMHHAQALKDRFQVILVFSPKKEDVRSLKFNLEGYDVSFPVVIDENGDFPRLNPHIPDDQRLHSFLLDKNNKVVLVGNPIGNEPLWELYKEQIRNLINAKE